MKKIFLISLLSLLLILPAFILAQTALVNINTAGLEELDKIPEVGPATAAKIIEYRTINGPFKTIEGIQAIKGIGSGVTYSKMKDFITVDPSGTISDSSLNQVLIEDNNENLSAHTGENEISNYEKPETFKIGAGRERLATTRTPILFLASQNKRGRRTNSFTWSFGDGTSAMGVRVSHSYQFPGRYNVVLNGVIDGEEEAVARTVVVVTEAKTKITNVDTQAGFVEIANQGNEEQNLNGWTLRSGDKIYFLSPDTIISPMSSIKTPLVVIGLANSNLQEITLNYPDGGVASGASLQTAQIKASSKKTAVQEQPIAEVGPLSNVNQVVVAKKEEKSKNVVILNKEPSWFEKIKNAIFK